MRYGDFPEVHSLLQTEKRLREMRKLGNIADILGDQFLKVDSLNLRCYVLTFEDLDQAPIIIEDNTLLASPPLTVASSPALAMVESNQEEFK